MAVQGVTGQLVPLNNLTKMSKGYAPRTLHRENGKSIARITATVNNQDLAKIGRDLDRLTAAIELPRGYTFEKGQQFSELETSLRGYVQALVLSLLLIYLVMAAIFESYLLPFSILTTVPLAFVGVYWSMYLTGTFMDTVAFIGTVLMCGVVVNNGIVIVDHVNRLRRDGLNRHDAIVQGGRDRFRPVMMTALTTILGCVPLAIGSAKGDDALNSIGRALVGGLTSGTLLTLLVVPLVYSIVDDGQLWLRHYAANLASVRGRRGPLGDSAPGEKC
jgi:HAE1 family hydrophobic/amphiphilic exporter-1